MTDKLFRYISLMCGMRMMHPAGLACMLTLVIAGCSGGAPSPDEPDEPETPAAACIMQLHLDLGSAAAPASRVNSTDSEVLESGSGRENYIDPQDLQVYLFEATASGADETASKLICCLTSDLNSSRSQIQFEPIDDKRTVYRLSFDVKDVLENAETDLQSFKVMVLANWGTYPEVTPGVTTVADILNGSEADFASPFTLSADNDNKIPFYGIRQYDNIRFTRNVPVQPAGDLWLLRALAKIDVCDADDSERKIAYVQFYCWNSKYYRAPLKPYDAAGGTQSVTDPSLPDGTYQGSGWVWPQYQNGGYYWCAERDADNHIVFYTVEFKNTGRPTEVNKPHYRSEIVITYDDGEQFLLEFKYYSGENEGMYYDLLRNYWYQFVVKRTGKKIDVCIEPYEIVANLEPEFGI